MALPVRSESRHGRHSIDRAAEEVRRARKLVKKAKQEAAFSDDKKIRKAANGSKKELDKAVAETNELVDVWIERIEQSD